MSFTINEVQIEKYFIYLDEMFRGGYKVWQLEGEMRRKFGISGPKARCVFRHWNTLTHTNDAGAVENAKSRVTAARHKLQDMGGWDTSDIDDDPGETGKGD